MADFLKVWDTTLMNADLVIEGAAIVDHPGLWTVVINSLFTDARATPEQLAHMDLPSTDDPRGWWGDSYSDIKGDVFGSHLWTLAREKQTQETLNRAVGFAEAALAWMISDGVATAVEIEAEWLDRGLLGMRVALVLPDGKRAQDHFAYALPEAA